jgi:alpha-glutamyl/putrescinyl thymine pyrophosphorylase clade 1
MSVQPASLANERPTDPSQPTSWCRSAAADRRTSLPALHRGRPLPRPTAVFDTYWQFAVERQEIYYRRLAGEPAPWTTDEIIRAHRFTNAYRVADRVSQYLVHEVLYKGDQQPGEVFFRALLFKLFNKVETWELLVSAVGCPTTDGFDLPRFDQVLTRARGRGRPIYSAAYIMPSASVYGSKLKHTNHLRLLRQMLADGLPDQIGQAKTLAQVFARLREYPSLGDFLAYQLAIDINYSGLIDFSEMEFVVPGPGAREGIRKCFSNWDVLDGAELIRWVTETQEEQLARRGLTLRTLWGRPLQLVDCQNLFCEVGKYARVAHPEATPVGGRTRIKQVYRASTKPLQPWFPPKWKINERVVAERDSGDRFGTVNDLEGAGDKITAEAPPLVLAQVAPGARPRQNGQLPLPWRAGTALAPVGQPFDGAQ